LSARKLMTNLNWDRAWNEYWWWYSDQNNVTQCIAKH
jgi:hypothetical protein